VHIQNDIITIEWNPWEKDDSFDAEFQRFPQVKVHITIMAINLKEVEVDILV